MVAQNYYLNLTRENFGGGNNNMANFHEFPIISIAMISTAISINLQPQ